MQFSGLPEEELAIQVSREDRGLDLYVNGVLIQNKNKDLIPEYLAFCKGLVESPDVPLNISRETLQENLVIQKISAALVKQILNHLGIQQLF